MNSEFSSCSLEFGWNVKFRKKFMYDIFKRRIFYGAGGNWTKRKNIMR